MSITLAKRVIRGVGRRALRWLPAPIADRIRRKKQVVTFSLSMRAPGPLDDVRFTVIIPTLDRSATLGATIRSCLSQDDRNLTVIVSDNASTDDTAKVVASFSDQRLKYVNPGRRLGMTEHWEFALGHAEPGFLTVLGDDDALLPGAILAARRLISHHDVKALTWQKAEYHWPDHIVPEFRNWLQVPLKGSVSILKAPHMIAEVAAFRAGYTRLPCVYNSFVSTDLIAAYRERNGGVFFGGPIPDIYSGFALASELDGFLFCERPLSLNGASSKSNGTLQTVGAKSDKLAASFWQDTKFRFEPELPNSSSIVEFCIADSFLKVRKVAKGLSAVTVDNKALLRAAVEATFSGFIPETRREDRLTALKHFAKMHGCEPLFDDLCREARQRPRNRGLPQPGSCTDQFIVFDATVFSAWDAHSAALRAAEVLELIENKPELFSRLVNSRRPDLAVALFARSNGQKLRLHLGCGQSHLEGYINVDYPQSKHNVMTVRPDICCDLTLIDLPDGTVGEVRLQHVFEHLNRAVALASLIRWHRWLEVEGRLHIETPDFEASARALLASDDFAVKMRAIRHLEGDQADGWAYHVGQWFPERFKRTFSRLGFDEVEVRSVPSSHEPPLHNVVAIARKAANKGQERQIADACVLLRDFMIDESEEPLLMVWRGQLNSILSGETRPEPEIFHPAAMAESAAP